MKYSDADYNKLKYYYACLSQSKATYISNYESFYSFKLHLLDKYPNDEFEDFIEKHYTDWEKLVSLHNTMLVSLSDFECAIRNLYNFKIVLRQTYADFGSFIDLRSSVN